MPPLENKWDYLSRRCYGLNREFIKHICFAIAYRSEEVDPWLAHILTEEMKNYLLQFPTRRLYS